jgi:hypothetical protein
MTSGSPTLIDGALMVPVITSTALSIGEQHLPRNPTEHAAPVDSEPAQEKYTIHRSTSLRCPTVSSILGYSTAPKRWKSMKLVPVTLLVSMVAPL